MGSPGVCVVLARDCSDFFVIDGSSFSVWWGGDWWEHSAEVAAFSPDGSSLARWHDGQIELWRISQTRPAWSQPLAWSGPSACSDPSTGTRSSMRRRIPPERLQLHFNSSGTKLGAVLGKDITIYDVATGESLFQQELQDVSRFQLGERHFLANRTTIADSGQCLGIGAEGVWLQQPSGLCLRPFQGELRKIPLEGWSNSQCQMFEAFPQADIVVRDWGVWRLSNGRCLLAPAPMSPDLWQRHRDQYPGPYCAFDPRRGRLLIRHPSKALQVFRWVDPTPIAKLSRLTLEARLELSYLEEEKALWRLALELLGQSS